MHDTSPYGSCPGVVKTMQTIRMKYMMKYDVLDFDTLHAGVAVIAPRRGKRPVKSGDGPCKRRFGCSSFDIQGNLKPDKPGVKQCRVRGKGTGKTPLFRRRVGTVVGRDGAGSVAIGDSKGQPTSFGSGTQKPQDQQ